ncbi:hypothetical protein [Metabacillus arenae]|uniref:Uncharacterized protein n=1 Tax=Metabacillus arenae TaxID=2771434 RepID=A0A926NK38_9BACI|nr:hypothetical protein [Metabacillus arenae]MBD1382811.1 hypothetical protein [Metabacillus arenae]
MRAFFVRSLLKKKFGLQQTYSGWTEFVIGYELGVQFYAVETALEKFKKNKKYLQSLIYSRHSPMNKVDWNVQLPNSITFSK